MWGLNAAQGWGDMGGKSKIEALGLSFHERNMVGLRFGQREPSWGGVSWGLSAGKWGLTTPRGWGDLGGKLKTEPLGLSFHK